MNRHVRPVWPWLIAAAAALPLLAPAVSAQTVRRAAAPPPRYGGTLNLATQFAPPHLDAAQAADGVSIQFTAPIYEPLVTYAETSGQIVGDLATRWQVLDGGREYIFYLRPGVRFSNGDPLTAQDVVFTFTRLNEQATAAPYQSSFSDIVGASALYAGKAKTLAGIQAVGTNEVVMRLVSPERYWLNVVALPSAAIEDAKVAQKWNAQEHGTLKQPIQPVGTGPFMLEPVTANTTDYVYVRNPYYWHKGLPYLDKIVIHVGPSPSLQLEQFARGELGALPPILAVPNLTSGQYLQVLRTPALKRDYFDIPSPGTYYLGFNPAVKPWNNLDLRRAVEYAVNKVFMNRVLNNSRALVANSVLPPGIPGYEPNYNPYPYSLAKARALVKAAGYPNGVNAGTFYVPEFGDPQAVASIVKEDLAQIGITVTPQLISLNSFFTLMTHPDRIGFYWLQWGQDYPDAQDFLYNLFDSAEAGNNNVDWYNNPTVDRLLNQADTSLDQPLRIRLYDQVQHIVMSQAVVVPLTFNWADGLIGPNVYPKTPAVWSNAAPGYAQLQYVYLAP